MNYWQTQAVVGDLNGDGKLDVIVCANAGGCSELLGNGDGTFRPAENLTANSQSLYFSLVDLNGDGNLDLVSAGYSSNAFSVLLGEGGGRFSHEIVHGAGSGPKVVVAADFNGDGKPDLISLQYNKFCRPNRHGGPEFDLHSVAEYDALSSRTSRRE